MSWQHVIVIISSFAIVVACGFHGHCSDQMTIVGDIAKMVIAGALGNALGNKRQRDPN